MAKAKNKVMAGYSVGEDVCIFYNGSLFFNPTKENRSINLNSKTVDSYSIISQTSSKSATSAVGRAVGGSLLFGGAGIMAGLSAKSNDIYTIALELKEGKRCIIEIDQERYNALMTAMFL